MAGAKVLFLAGYLLSGALCSEFTIKMPKRIEALSGSCVLIPCTFNTPAEYENQLMSPRGIWIKHISQFANPRSTVVFNSSRTHNTLSGEIVGDLGQKNCTTVLDMITKRYTDKYFFRIETSSFKATFKTPVSITVTGSPHKPNINKQKDLNESTLLDLKCTAAAPCNKHLPVLTWTPNFGNTRLELQENSILSVLTFTPSHLHHGKNITCASEYTLQNGSKIKVADNMTLNVLFSPKNTTASISPTGPLVSGSLATLTCSSWANPPVSDFTWFRITEIQTTRRGSGQTFTFNVSSGDVGRYYCEAQNQQGKQKSEELELTLEGDWEPLSLSLIGGIVGTLGVLLACSLLLLYLRKKSRGSCISKWMTSREGQSDPSFDPNKANNKETTTGLESQQEEVQYAEIQFSKQQVKDKRGKEETHRQETEYAEVQFSVRNGKASIEEIYAKVKRKHHP